ncbi:hypothetical protein C8R45DRAFT_209970 [Mycena sanguinolenta]|nr:hypothetical protein C8R45DRAFT_209970 [Mycena sanguinolenta]
MSEAFAKDQQFIIQAQGAMTVPLTVAIKFSDCTLSNPIRPQYCAQLLHGAWYRMFASEEDGALPVAFAFIVARRTDDQMNRLIHGLSQCHCAPVDPDDKPESAWISVFHNYAAEALGVMKMDEFPFPLTHFHALMKIISTRILETLRKTSPMKLVKGRKEWPASLDDVVLPSVGPETIVKSLEQWARHMSIHDPWPIELLGTIAILGYSLIVPAILQSPSLIPTILLIAHQICDDAAPHLSPRSSPPKLIEVTRQLFWRLSFISAFFRYVFLGPGCRPTAIDEVSIERKTAIVQMCGRAIDMLRSPLVVQHAPKKERTDLIDEFSHNMMVFLAVEVSTEGIHPDTVNEVLDKLERLIGPTRICSLLRAWKGSLRCYAKACEKSLQTSSTFQQCSSCRIISYCGKECQRRAWSDHKPLCKTIIKIIRDGGGDIHSKEFSRNCETGRVDARDAAQVVEARGIWRKGGGSL